MVSNEKDASNLEQLLGSLIKMVGKANQNVDSLQKRVSQLEWLIKEHQLEFIKELQQLELIKEQQLEFMKEYEQFELIKEQQLEFMKEY